MAKSMEGDMLNDDVPNHGEVQYGIRPAYIGKTLWAMKAPRKVKRVTFNNSKAEPGDTLFVNVPRLGQNEVILPNSLALIFNIDLSGGHANNFLVQNVSQALVEKLVVKLGTEVLDRTINYDIYKIFQDLFLSVEKRGKMVYEGIQSEELCKIRTGAGDAKTSGVETEKKLNKIYKKKYRINLDHQILTDNGAFYPRALKDDLVFELTLAPANQVVRGSDTTKLNYKLTNIQLEYEMVRSEKLAKEAYDVYGSGKMFVYDHVARDKVVQIKKGEDTMVNIKVNAQRRSMKGILLLFVEKYVAGARDSEKYIFPDLEKIDVTISGSSNMLYDSGIDPQDFWREVSRFFIKEKYKPHHMTMERFYTENKFGLLIDLRSMDGQEMHGSGIRLVNSTDGVQIEIERERRGSGTLNCHVFIISDAQLNIQNNQLDSMQY